MHSPKDVTKKSQNIRLKKLSCDKELLLVTLNSKVLFKSSFKIYE